MGLKKLADLGVVLVAAGGNSGPRPDDTDFPASDIHVISVGALDKKLVVKPDFRQPTVTFMLLENQCVPSVINQSTTDVCHVDGTSFAAPILGGFLALLLESANNKVSNSTFVIEKCHDINFLNTLFKDHKLVRDYKLWYAHEVVEKLQEYILFYFIQFSFAGLQIIRYISLAGMLRDPAILITKMF